MKKTVPRVNYLNFRISLQNQWLVLSFECYISISYSFHTSPSVSSFLGLVNQEPASHLRPPTSSSSTISLSLQCSHVWLLILSSVTSSPSPAFLSCQVIDLLSVEPCDQAECITSFLNPHKQHIKRGQWEWSATCCKVFSVFVTVCR